MKLEVEEKVPVALEARRMGTRAAPSRYSRGCNAPRFSDWAKQCPLHAYSLLVENQREYLVRMVMYSLLRSSRG